MTQVFPTTDAFAYGTPAYGDLVTGWLNLQTGGVAPECRLHNGYAGGAASYLVGSNPEQRSTGFVRRDTFAEDVRVRAVLRKAVKSGVAASEHLLRHGVYARITNGTIASASDRAVILEAVTGYGFEIEKATVGDFTVRLVRIDAGTRTVLTSVSGTVFSGQWTQDHEMILWVQTSGDGSVDLRAQLGGQYITGGGGGGPIVVGGVLTVSPGGHGGWGTVSSSGASKGSPAIQSPANIIGPSPGLLGGGGSGQLVDTPAVTILTWNDPPSSAVTGVGRCGFRIDSERLVGSAQTLSLCRSFVVEDISDPQNPAVSYRDEFARYASAETETIVDAHGTTGTVVADDYSTGRFAENLGVGDAITRATGSEQAQLGNVMDFGNGAVCDGSANAVLVADDWPSIFSGVVAPAATFQVTVAMWLNVTTNQDAGLFRSASGAIGGTEWAFDWEDAGASTFRLRLVTNTGTYATDAISESAFVGSTVCYVMSYKAGADASTGDGRVRFYTGAGGMMTLQKEVVVDAADQPAFGGDGNDVELCRELDGTVDGLSVFWRELPANEINIVGNQAFGQQAEVADLPGFAHGCDFETRSGNDYLPFYPGGLSLGTATEVWNGDTGVSNGTGLLPAVAGSRVLTLDQRGERSPTTQTRSLDVTLRGAFSVFGIFLRATQATSGHTLTGASGYLVEVGIGSPAPINAYRVVSGVLTRLASQAGSIAITEDVAFTLSAAVAEQSGSKLSASVDGAAVTWTLDGSIGGNATITIGGLAVVDVGPGRVTGGPTSGFAAAADTDATYLNDWTAGTIAATNAAFSAVSGRMPQEGDGATGDLADVLLAEYALTQRTSTTQAGQFRTVDGHGKRWLLDSYEPRSYRLGVTGLTTTERDALRAFWEAHMPVSDGGFPARRIPFSWSAGTQADVPGEPDDGLWVFDGRISYAYAGVLHTAGFSIVEVQSPITPINAPPEVVPDPPVILDVTAP